MCLMLITYTLIFAVLELWLWGDGGGGHWLVRMEWRPAGCSVCLPLLISPCTIKSRSSLLAPAHPGGPGKRAVKRLCAVELWLINNMASSDSNDDIFASSLVLVSSTLNQKCKFDISSNSKLLKEDLISKILQAMHW